MQAQRQLMVRSTATVLLIDLLVCGSTVWYGAKGVFYLEVFDTVRCMQQITIRLYTYMCITFRLYADYFPAEEETVVVGFYCFCWVAARSVP